MSKPAAHEGQHAELAPVKGLLLMLIATLSFSTMGALLKAALQDLPVITGVFFRSLVSAVLLGLLVGVKGVSFTGQRRWLLASRSVLGFMAMCSGFFALSKIPLSDATVLHHTSPLWVAFFSILFLGERVTGRLAVLLGASFAGVLLIIRPSFDMWNVPGLLGAVGGALAGLAYVHVRELHRTEHTWTIAFHFTSFSTVASLPLLLWLGRWPDGQELFLLLGAGLMGTFGQLFMTGAYRYDHASRLAPYTYFSVVLALIYGFFFFAEVPPLPSWIGLIIVSVCGVCIYRLKRPPVQNASSVDAASQDAA